MEEVKTVVGWAINTRKLTVALTDDKFKEWTKDLAQMITEGSTTHDELDTTIGRLNHAATIIPLFRHFIHTFRNLLKRCGKKPTSLNNTEKRYLHLWITFLTKTNKGISINNIVFRQPTHLRWDDSCPIGIGGLSITGRAYRYHIPRHLQGRVSNNGLEFLASVVGCY